MTADQWIGVAGVVAVLVVGIGGWYFVQSKASRNQVQKVGREGKGIQSGRDTKTGE